ncbi:MAG: tRNA (adenosine(37)-N6)-threonylcarbamoyltransferase complex dimerization subunit type 1 TsaB [Anaerolineales bacterium]|nr:tRNA (adenosine(37)-N6)-threonylcarbamoyltransferase complex dimerization subunit type 1 TsaB [Anaerolineales bacterium]
MLLAIDSSTRVAGIALYDGVQVVAETVWVDHDNHTVHLAGVIDDTLKRCGVAVSSLHSLAVAIGPGSFTALRIGLAIAKGIAFSRGIPLIGIPTLDILAAAQPVMDVPLIAILRSGRGRLAVGYYHADSGFWQATGEIEILTVMELSEKIKQPTFICGELTGEERRLLGRKWVNVILASPAQSFRKPVFLAELGWQRWEKGQFDDTATLAPLYFHPGDKIPG